MINLEESFDYWISRWNEIVVDVKEVIDGEQTNGWYTVPMAPGLYEYFTDGIMGRPESDLPSSSYNTLVMFWKMGKVHRINGPARFLSDGRVSWWLDGMMMPFDEWLERTPISVGDKVLLKLRWA